MSPSPLLISRPYLVLPGSSYTTQRPAYIPQRIYHSMSHTQFPNGTHLDSMVFSTEGLNPQVDNPWNGQAQTVTTGEIYGVGDVPAQYDQCLGQHDQNAFYGYGKFLWLCHR